MYRSNQRLISQLASRKPCPNWPRVPIALVVAVLLVTAFVLTIGLGGFAMHHSITASGIAWGRL